ncbi:MAG TPA: hypothetical protein PK760_05740 [Flavobacteriales bacterium]|nr:hypothetical protein [Flavobacteriales bacterium]
MSKTTTILSLSAFLLSTSAAAQVFPFTSNERPTEGWPAEVVEIYQPVVIDTSLLFPKPWLVWQCACSWPNEYEFFYDVDFRTVRKCWGRKEVFDRVSVNGQYGFVQRGLGELHAMLVENDDGLLYKELTDDDAEPTRTVQLRFDTDQVLRTDTAAVGAWGHEGLVTRITHYVELKPVR